MVYLQQRGSISLLLVWVLPQDSVTLHGVPPFLCEDDSIECQLRYPGCQNVFHTACVGFEGQAEISFICRHCEGNSRLQAADIMDFLVFPSRDTHPFIFLLLSRREKKISLFGNGVKVKR